MNLTLMQSFTDCTTSAFRDGSAGTYQNRTNPPTEGDFGGRGRGRGGSRGRGGTGSRGGRGRDDRHSKTNIG
jgi:hypothetical protein